MKARRLSYWLGLLCLAVLVFMPDITVNAQPDPAGQGSNGQLPNEVGGQGTATQTSEGEQPPEELQPPDGQGSSNQEPTEPRGQRTMKVGEHSLIESGCQHTETSTSPIDGSVWKGYHCPFGSEFEGGEPGGLPGWICLVSPDRANHPWIAFGIMIQGANAEIMRGECVPPVRGGGADLREPTENGQSSREVNVKKIVEPDSSDSQGESDQQQAQSDVAQIDEEAQGEEDKGEENKASNQSQENNNSKQGYGCSANP